MSYIVASRAGSWRRRADGRSHKMVTIGGRRITVPILTNTQPRVSVHESHRFEVVRLPEYLPVVECIAPARSVRIGMVSEDAVVASQLAQQFLGAGMRVVRIVPRLTDWAAHCAIDVLVVVDSDGEALHRFICRPKSRAQRVLAIVGYNSPEARAQWLDAGADDCVSFPAPTVELVARARALARRGAIGKGARERLRVGDLTLNLSRREAQLRGNRLELTSHEFDLLVSLAQAAGSVLSREQLLELTRGVADDTFDRAIDVQVSRLRVKLGDDPRDPKLLKTVRGKGYFLQGS